MSENNLEKRNKYISKIQKKASELDEAIKLLARVDKKIFNKQSGGGLHSFGVNLASLGARADAFKTAMANASGLASTLSTLESSISTYQNQLDAILNGLDFDKDALAGFDKDSFDMLNAAEMQAINDILGGATKVIAISSDAANTGLVDSIKNSLADVEASIRDANRNPVIKVAEQQTIIDELHKRIGQGLHDSSSINKVELSGILTPKAAALTGAYANQADAAVNAVLGLSSDQRRAINYYILREKILNPTNNEAARIAELTTGTGVKVPNGSDLSVSPDLAKVIVELI